MFLKTVVEWAVHKINVTRHLAQLRWKIALLIVGTC